MEDWSDILSPMQWSKAIRMPVIVYRDPPGVHPISKRIPVNIESQLSDTEVIQRSVLSALSPRTSSRGISTVDASANKIYFKRNNSDPLTALKSVEGHNIYNCAKGSTKVWLILLSDKNVLVYFFLNVQVTSTFLFSSRRPDLFHLIHL